MSAAGNSVSTGSKSAYSMREALNSACLRLQAFLDTFGDLGDCVTQADLNDWIDASDAVAQASPGRGDYDHGYADGVEWATTAQPLPADDKGGGHLCPYDGDEGCILEQGEVGPCLCVNPVAAPQPASKAGDEIWGAAGYWEYVGGLAGEFEADQMRDMLAQKGLQIVGINDLAYSAWQPIETAPKKGCVLIAGGTFESSMSMAGECAFVGPTIASYDEWDKLWKGDNAGGHDEFYWHKPTHWMPIPTYALPSTNPGGET